MVNDRMESISAAGSSRTASLSLDFTEAAVALEGCWGIRGQLATFRGVLRSFSSARTDTAQPAVLQSQR